MFYILDHDLNVPPARVHFLGVLAAHRFPPTKVLFAVAIQT